MMRDDFRFVFFLAAILGMGAFIVLSPPSWPAHETVAGYLRGVALFVASFAVLQAALIVWGRLRAPVTVPTNSGWFLTILAWILECMLPMRFPSTNHLLARGVTRYRYMRLTPRPARWDDRRSMDEAYPAQAATPAQIIIVGTLGALAVVVLLAAVTGA